MNKKIISVMLCSVAVLSLTACGGGKDNTETTEVKEATKWEPEIVITKRSGEFDIKPAELVTKLAEYDKIELEVDKQYEPTEEAQQQLLTYLLSGYGGDAYLEIKDRDTIEETDYVKVNYTGYLNDEAFQNGSAEGALIDVKNNKMAGGASGLIEGFTKDFVGKKVGDKFSSDVTFPEEYPMNPDLAGKQTRFDFEVLGIYSDKEVGFADLKDEEVAKLFEQNLGIKTAEDLKKAIKGELDRKLVDVESEILKKKVVEGSEITIPEDYLEARVQEYLASIEKENCNDTMNLEAFFQSQNYTYDDAVASIRSNLESQIKVELVFQVIADELKLTVDEEGFKSYVSYILSNSNGSLVDENAAYEYFGAGNAEEGKTYLQNQYLVNLTVNKVIETAKVTYKDTAAQPTGDEATTEDSTQK